MSVFTSAAAAIILSLAFSAAPGWESPDPAGPRLDPPSVLLVTLDTVRADHLGCYGYSQIETPALDHLAAEGLRFASAYAQAPITLPSHTVILTGTYPMFNGVRDFTSSGLRANTPTLAEIFQRHGYRTAAFVSSFVLNSMWGLDRGFEVYDDNVGAGKDGARDVFLLERRGDRTVDRTLDWLNLRAGRPFFVWLHLYDPHSPYRPPEPYRTRYSGRPYDGEIAFDDSQVARVIARLRSLDVYENTLIVILGDHGESLGEHGESEHGFFVYNATLRIPLILKLPGKKIKGRVLSEPVGTIDVAPTVVQICKLPAEESRTFQGHSLLGTGGETRPREEKAVYAESYYSRNSFGWCALRSLVTSQFKYIEAPRAELYDLGRDPGERSNAIATNSAAAGSLRERLADFEKRFQGSQGDSPAAPLDPETLEKLKSLGYLSYQGPSSANVANHQGADPKDEITTLNRILRAADVTRLGKYAEADQLLLALEQEEPELYVLHFQKGENYLAWGKPQLAVAEFGKALARNPAFDQAALGLGRAYFLLGRDEQAAAALQLAIHLNPRNFLASLALTKVYWRENMAEKAETLLTRVVKEHPDFAEGRTDYGIILAKLGKYREALPEIEQGIKLGYRDPIAYNYLGIARAEVGDTEGAIRAYEEAVALNPRYAAPYLNLALLYRRQGRLVKAQAYYRKVCELSQKLCQQYAPQFSGQPR
jgi:choline-sulfatase